VHGKQYHDPTSKGQNCQALAPRKLVIFIVWRDDTRHRRLVVCRQQGHRHAMAMPKQGATKPSGHITPVLHANFSLLDVHRSTELKFTDLTMATKSICQSKGDVASVWADLQYYWWDLRNSHSLGRPTTSCHTRRIYPVRAYCSFFMICITNVRRAVVGYE